MTNIPLWLAAIWMLQCFWIGWFSGALYELKRSIRRLQQLQKVPRHD